MKTKPREPLVRTGHDWTDDEAMDWLEIVVWFLVALIGVSLACAFCTT